MLGTLAVEARALTKRYGDRIAVDNVDLDVRGGEVFGLLGLNGAGKTTTVGMLTCRLRLTSGRAVVAGVDVSADPAEAKRRLGVVTQGNTLDRSLTLEENLRFHARYFGLRRGAACSKARELLDRFRLGSHAAARVDTLSGGLAQRAMLARALVHDPAVLFLDEPTNGLDVEAQHDLWTQVGDLTSAGVTVILSTHRMDEAEQRCDQLGIIHDGRFLLQGTPGELQACGAAGRVVRFETTACVTDVLERDGMRVLDSGSSTAAVEVADSDDVEAAIEGVLRACRQSNAALVSVQVGGSSLEVSFLRAIREASGFAGTSA